MTYEEAVTYIATFLQTDVWMLIGMLAGIVASYLFLSQINLR
jgi:hypothetical protein